MLGLILQHRQYIVLHIVVWYGANYVLNSARVQSSSVLARLAKVACRFLIDENNWRVKPDQSNIFLVDGWRISPLERKGFLEIVNTAYIRRMCVCSSFLSLV